jgi:Flp pilus assembly protein TadG
MSRHHTSPFVLRRRTGGESGQAMVEFALVLPLLLLLLLGVLDFAKSINYWNDQTHLASEAARFAVVNDNPNTSGSLASWIKSQADTSELRGGVSVCIAAGAGASSPPAVGDPITATTTYTYSWLPLIGRVVGATTTINVSSTMRLETPLSAGVLGCA